MMEEERKPIATATHRYRQTQASGGICSDLIWSRLSTVCLSRMLVLFFRSPESLRSRPARRAIARRGSC